MTEKEFKERFQINFVASYAAMIYDECCIQGQHKKLEQLPIEDAIFLANQTWKKYLELVK